MKPGPFLMGLLAFGFQQATSPLTYAAEAPFLSCRVSCPFLDTCAGGGNCSAPQHLGTDYGAPVGAVIRSPVDGIVVHTGWHDGYGGTVLIQTTINNADAVVLAGHMMCDNGCLDPLSDPRCTSPRPPGSSCLALQVHCGDTVIAGQSPLGIVGPNNKWQNGRFGPHLHLGVRTRTYRGTCSVANPWVYWGYTNIEEQCTTTEWQDPDTIVPCPVVNCEDVVGNYQGL